MQLVAGFSCKGDGEAEKSKELAMALLEYSPDPFSRTIFTPGHITCTGVVLSPDRSKVLLVHHARLNRWLLPGGHVEPEDAAIPDVARREVLEETGADLAQTIPVLVGIDVHPIPANSREPLHLHHDLIFSFQARAERVECSLESREVLWCAFDKFEVYKLPASIRRAAGRAADLCASIC